MSAKIDDKRIYCDDCMGSGSTTDGRKCKTCHGKGWKGTRK